MPAKNLVEKVWEAGVVGAGGAGFPTWKKIAARVDTVVANGAECEPLLRNDQQVMAARAGEVVRGVALTMQATGAKRGIIALKKKYTAAIANLQKELRGSPAISLHLLESVYPAGDEFVLVYETTGRVVPPGAIPLQVGVVVSNVETFLNVSRAETGDPVVSRYLTVAGAVREPKVVRLPIGAPLRAALELAGGTKLDDFAVVTGGPMMGAVAENLDQPVTKTTSSAIVLPVDHPVVARKTRALDFDLRSIQETCCQCVYCTLVCPRSLLGHNFKPHLVMRSLALGLPSPEARGVSDAPFCCACDLCGVYACPMNLPIGRYNKQVAGKLKEMNWERALPEESCVPSPLREFSLVPVSRLTERLGLKEFDRPAPLLDRDVPVPRVVIPLRQHLGAAAKPVVKKGARVRRGDVIGDLPREVMGARVHASISGKVTKVTEELVVITS
ncbi:MAG: SLBB domain-containing protein [Candidatus Aureabacteria bacterium]|nr:SLBB domain-containing protein [Candidatus Auribacterota bacterium]